MDLKTTRASKRITQMRLWKKTGIAQRRLSLLENNYISPSAEERRKIARALNVSQDEIDWLENGG